MRTVISKYELPTEIGKTTLRMRRGAEILTAELQQNKLCLWALLDQTEEFETRMFSVEVTDDFIDSPTSKKYIATVQQGRYVWHVFEVMP